MKKELCILMLFFLIFGNSNAQDVIIKKTGEEIKSKVITVSDSEIEYSKFENLEGPKYRINKAEVLLIMYSNGTKDIFTSSNSETRVKEITPKQEEKRVEQRYYSIDFFNRKVPVTFLGVDFSKAKIIGETISNPQALFLEINALFVSEKGKYDMKGAFRRSILPYQFSIVDKNNSTVENNALFENTNNNITFTNIQAIVDDYDFASIGLFDGLALVIICDNLNKPRQDAAYFYVVVDVISKKVLISDRVIGRAGGNGLRNYYARSLYETIVQFQEKKFGLWKSMYGRR